LFLEWAPCAERTHADQQIADSDEHAVPTASLWFCGTALVELLMNSGTMGTLGDLYAWFLSQDLSKLCTVG
jgi:hypothetical protein